MHRRGELARCQLQEGCAHAQEPRVGPRGQHCLLISCIEDGRSLPRKCAYRLEETGSSAAWPLATWAAAEARRPYGKNCSTEPCSEEARDKLTKM